MARDYCERERRPQGRDLVTFAGIGAEVLCEFVGVNDEHVLALVEAVHGAHVDAVHDFAVNTALVDDEGQLSVLSADRSGNLIHGVGPSSRCSFIG